MYTPVFNKIRKLLTPIILKLLAKSIELSILDIGKEIKRMKKSKEGLELVIFVWLSDYSDTIHKVLKDMIVHSLVKQTRRGYKLTSLGIEYATKDLRELEKMYD